MPGLGLVFQIGSLGDSILSLPSVHSLRELLPDCSEYLIVDRFDDATKIVAAEVLQMVLGNCRSLNYLGGGPPARRVQSIASLAKRLRYYRPNYAVYLMPSDRSPRQVWRDRCFFRAAGVREFVGFRSLDDEENGMAECPGVKCSEAYLRFKRLWKERTHEKFAIHSRTPLLKPDDRARKLVDGWLHANRRFPARPLVALCPFSNWPSKDLSPEAAVKLLWKLENEAGAEAVLIGGAKDIVAARRLVERSRSGFTACGTFSVGEAAALFQKCSLAVAVDSGPMHLAAAVGVPTVVVYSRTNKHLDRWFPLGDGHTILYREVACAGCDKPACSIPGHPCITEISVDEIFEAVMKKLQPSSLLRVLTPR